MTMETLLQEVSKLRVILKIELFKWNSDNSIPIINMYRNSNTIVSSVYGIHYHIFVILKQD